ncbi:TIGR02206 family membrane protein [Candidatus Formimonas warabiya]|uniref:TIGR02206 family membrane protein n=1 Tax=Formimonas warabiya TaxID=1761012 RepID=A0A3G1L062_FORW1|nr:TIGR02206 family membrane protein [Candidatus Formimonas warabiya]ATW28176.1 hypothetical protein DCMF_28520 [Candidatus Formimonas warabiya]
MHALVFGLTFRPFSFYHMGALAMIPLLGFLLFHFRQMIRQKKINRIIRGIFFVIIVGNELSGHIWLILHHQWSITWAAPLQLCDLSALLSAILLLKNHLILYELVYFWGLGGAVQALLTPDIGSNPVPLFWLLQFFISHGMIIITCLFFTFVERFRPSVKSIGKTILATNLYAVLIGFFNWCIGANYLYICHKPAAPSLLDYLGPWPWYIFSLELVLGVMCCLLYLPFLILDRFKPVLIPGKSDGSSL